MPYSSHSDGDIDWTEGRPDEQSIPAHKKRKTARVVLSLLVLLLLGVVVLLLGIRQYTVVGGSMEPTLRTGDRVYYTGFTKLRFNDLVIFDAGSLYGRVVKRVAGLPGDTISISADGRLIRNHVLEEEPFILPDQLGNSGMQEITVAAGTVFVLGDNRAESIDSRDSRIGLIRQDAILGVVTNFIREIGG